MKPFVLVAVLAATAALNATLAGCVAPVGPVEVTRFHQPAARLGGGAITVEPASGVEVGSLEFRSYAAAVARELVRVGYVEAAPGSGSAQVAPHVAIVGIEREVWQPGREESPVSVGVGGSTGSYGSGVGIGIGLNLSGPPPEETQTELSVMIRDRASGQSLWEGRARFSVRSSSPLAQTQLGAAKLAEALFRDFPGRSGETILVK